MIKTYWQDLMRVVLSIKAGKLFPSTIWALRPLLVNSLPSEQRSKGFEFSLAGEVLPGWNIIAGYAYTDTEITKDNMFAVGNLLNNVPKHSFNIWTSYEIQTGTWKGFGVGAGVFFAGDRQGDLANTFELPSYLRTDAAIFYNGYCVYANFIDPSEHLIMKKTKITKGGNNGSFRASWTK